MKKQYFMILAAAALCGASAMAEGTWHNVNYMMKNPAFIPGWSGALTATAGGVAEVYDGAFELYQVLPDMPAGEYTLTANAFYRYGGVDFSHENTQNGENHKAYIFLGTAKTPVLALSEEKIDAAAITLMNEAIGEGEEWMIAVNEDTYGTVPNGVTTANALFAAGYYKNTVTFSHPGGDLRLGIANTGGYIEEWCCFDNFKLVGPDGEVAIPNGDFSEVFNAAASDDRDVQPWDFANLQGASKTPDVNRAGGVFRKTNATNYNFGVAVELPAGKYRFGVQSFLRYGGAGNTTGGYFSCKANEWIEGEGALDRHVNGTEDEADNAYIYVTSGWDTDENGNRCKPISEDYALDEEYGNPDGFYLQTKIKCIFDEALDVYPDNEPATTGEVEAGQRGWCDSGYEAEAAACFVNNPDLYRNYVEFELEEAAEVWVGMKKDTNTPVQYWNPFRDFTIERYVESAGLQGVTVENTNAPVEYYNVNGMRVAEPTNGLYIVKQGNTVSKKFFRN